MADIHNFVDIQHALNGLNFGKRLPDALYIHHSTIPCLPFILQQYESHTRQIFYENYQFESPQDAQFTLIKFNLYEPKISYLDYPDFDLNPVQFENHSFRSSAYKPCQVKVIAP